MIINNTQQNALTSASFRAIDESAKNNDKEINNANSQRNLKAGTKLIGKYHKQPYTCEVVEVEGKLRFRLEDGREFKSTSAAGMAITGHPCDGWVFWSVQSSEEASATEIQQTETQQVETQESPQIASAPEAETTTPAEPVSTSKSVPMNFFKMEWQRAVPKGQTRWHCNICNKHFLAPPDRRPRVARRGTKPANSPNQPNNEL